MKFALGTKLDSSNRKAGLWVVACRAALKPVALLAALARLAVLVAGMMGFVAGSQANDSLAGLVDPTQPAYSGTSGGTA
ncbi:MAG: hypothetical protein AAB322_08875, partial [Pseudomonadota bacterium]